MEPSNNCLKLVETEEGLPDPDESGLYHAYHGKADKVGVWTIYTGITWYPSGITVREGDTCTKEQGDAYVRFQLSRVKDAINAHIGKTIINQNMFDALVDFGFNLGTNALLTSTLWKKLLIDPNDPTIYNYAKSRISPGPEYGSCEFLKWVESNHKVVSDLVERRERECLLYQGKVFRFKDGTQVSY